MSFPPVSDRVSRLEGLGIIRRFTLDLDRSKLRGGVSVLVDLSVQPDAVETVREAPAVVDAVGHVFTSMFKITGRRELRLARNYARNHLPL